MFSKKLSNKEKLKYRLLALNLVLVAFVVWYLWFVNDELNRYGCVNFDATTQMRVFVSGCYVPSSPLFWLNSLPFVFAFAVPLALLAVNLFMPIRKPKVQSKSKKKTG